MQTAIWGGAADTRNFRWDEPIGSLQSRPDYSLFATAPRRPPPSQKRSQAQPHFGGQTRQVKVQIFHPV